jgi:hypothetical protein
VEGEKTFASTSHDRGSKYNPETDRYEQWSANDDGAGCIRREGDAQVMVDLNGAGVLWRTWSARADGGHIKIFIEGQEKPIVDKPFRAYFDDLEKTVSGLFRRPGEGLSRPGDDPVARPQRVRPDLLLKIV